MENRSIKQGGILDGKERICKKNNAKDRFSRNQQNYKRTLAFFGH